ncbi:MAG: CapA family protein [Gemmatimonadales bacterium]|nr:CapA family protein [Gemmatimonadales bacterium]
MLSALAACSKAPPAPPAPVAAPDTAASPLVEPVSPPADLPPLPRILAPVRLAFTGDINLGTLTFPDGVPPEAGRGLFDAARDALSGDLVVGNFEGVLGDSGTTYKCGREGKHVTLADTAPPKPEPKPVAAKREARLCYAFLTPTALAPRLAEAGFTHLNLANNHANDFGDEARNTTERILDSLGLRTYGPLGSIAVDTIRKGDSLTTVGLLGFTTYPYAYDLLDIARSAAVVDSVRTLVDLLLVTFHGGAEGAKALHVPEAAESLGREPRGDLRTWTHAVIDAGADAVIGHGPHVLRGIELYRGKPIVYSLGNFLTYRGFNLSGPLGLTGVLQLEAGADLSWRRLRFVPMVQLPRSGPAPDSGHEVLDLVRTLSRDDFGDSGARIGDHGEVLLPE